MTPVEKKIAFHKHEANRRRLMGHKLEQGIHELAVKRLESKLPHEQACDPVLTITQASLVAYMMESQPIEFMRSMMKTQTVRPGDLPSSLVIQAASLVRHTPWEMKKADWRTVFHFLEVRRSAFELSHPSASLEASVNDIVTRIEEHLNNA